MDNFLLKILSLYSIVHFQLIFKFYFLQIHLSTPETKNTNATQSYHSYSQEMKTSTLEITPIPQSLVTAHFPQIKES